MTKAQRESIRAKMIALIKESEESTLNATDFITSKGLRPHIFYYWKRQYLNTKAQSKKKATFIPIAIREKQTTTGGQIEFFFTNGNRAVIKGDISATTLQTLMGL
jgi:hypothetical protein